MINNEHINKWREYTKQMIKASEEGNFNAMEDLKDLADSEYEAYKSENEYYDNIEESVNFGFANYIVENNVPHLLKNHREVLKEYVNLIKKDKNLSIQYNIIDNLSHCNCIEHVNDYVNEALQLAKKKIDVNTINESNKKLYKFIVDNNLSITNDIDDKLYDLYEACDYILTNKKTLKTLNEHIKQMQVITDYIQNNASVLSESKKNYNVDLNAFNEKYTKLLTTEEQEFVRNVINNKDKTSQQELFESLKDECINELGDSSECQTIREQISSMSYNENSFIEDINKLIEINNIIKQ